MAGGVAYFLGSYLGSSNVEADMFLKFCGIFLCGTVPVIVVMGPKFLAIQGTIRYIPVHQGNSSDGSLDVAVGSLGISAKIGPSELIDD